ncbi:DNA-dependent protein kinase catalytic subunit [Trichonephila clavipes]|nr:DNA-dependent protein kinase catalytic subunit [Trichonephila clavipes]
MEEILNAHLLSIQHGILGFLKNIVPFKEIKKIKHECFKLLDDILDQSGSLVQDYGSDMMAVCSIYVRRDVGAELKKASLVTISKVLEACCGCQGKKRINIESLINDLYFQLTLRSKLTSTVKEEIFCLIGIVAHYYPEEFIPCQEKMLALFLQELKVQVNSKSKVFDYNIVAGCLQALKEYLYNFSVLYSEDPENSYFIFNVSRKMISKPEKNIGKTSSVIKAALQLLAAHAPQFELFVFENCVDLYEDIMLWVQHQNRDMQKIGRDAVVSVLKVTADMVSSKYEEDKDNCTKIFNYFMRNFRDIFLSNNSSSKALQIAVIAYGLFAKPCKLCLSENEVKLMLQNIIQRCGHAFLSDSDDIDDRILELSYYLESLSSIVSVTEYVSENIIFSLEKLTVFQISKFPKVPSAYSFVVPKVVIRIMLSIQPKRELFLKFLAEVVYQGLVKTCSHPVIVEAESFKDKTLAGQLQNQNEIEYGSPMKIVTYKDYVYFWKSMLNVVQLKELNSLGIPLEHRQSLMETIYDELIHSSLSLISKLDLNLNQQKAEEIKYNMEDLSVELKNIPEDKLRSYQLFSKFVAEVAVRQEQFKDELLASCLQVLLSLPIEIVLHDINILIPALEHALKLGISYLPLASAAISALEKWSEAIPLNIIKSHFSRLLPHLNYYLLASTIQDDALNSFSNKKKINVKKVHKMSSKSVKKFNRGALDVVYEDPELLKIQHHIIKFLGRLGESNKALLENAHEKLDEIAIAWDSMYRSHLKYSVPFQDMKPDIYFDDFLPNILEIATKSSVRQAKVAACEALHSLVLFMIGQGSILPDDFQKKVTKQLFRPLVLQIIHWFTCSRVSKCPETSVILLCLWGKQRQPENLLNKLHSFSLHPNAFKRIGAALTFNNIYRIFRENEALVKKYTIQLLVQFVDSLAIAHTDNISLGDANRKIGMEKEFRQIVGKISLHDLSNDNGKRLIDFAADHNMVLPNTMFQHKNIHKITYRSLDGSTCNQIEHLVDSRHKSDILDCLCGTLNSHRAASHLVRLVEGEERWEASDHPGVFSLKIGVELSKIVLSPAWFENVLRNFSSSGSHNHKTLKSIVLWLEALEASMDCYHWAFSKQFLLQNELYGKKYPPMISSIKIFKTIEYYIESIVKESLISIVNRNERDQSELFTPEEVLKFNKLKCTVLIRLFTFIVSVFSPDAKWFHEQFMKVLWNSSLWEIILLSCVDPLSLGFDMTDPEISLKLPEEPTGWHGCFVVGLLHLKLRVRIWPKLVDFHNAENRQWPYCMTIQHVKDPYSVYLAWVLSAKLNPSPGYELLITNGFPASIIFQKTIQTEIISSLLDSIWNDSMEMSGSTLKKKTLTPVAFSLAEQMLSICYNLELRVDEMAMKLRNPSQEFGNSKKSVVERGLLIFNIFADSICSFASRTPDIFVKTLVNFLTKTSFTEVAILIKFIDYVACTRILRKT